MASLIADERGAAGLVCLGYPFHPPGKPDRLRTEHLRVLRTPTLICQGTRDPFGKRDEVAGYALAPSIRLAWIAEGDHSFTPRGQSGRSWAQLGAEPGPGGRGRSRLRRYAVNRQSLPRMGSQPGSDARKNPIPPASSQDVTCCRVGLTRAAS